ncbi:TetR family transcriptional regulator [Pseudoxanthomonas sp.]|uniref:TetR family transcriptional regulator n=1 Tax=Pseudoxanthomonas sp. TaxID=1871049 RepID=UPI0025EC92E8|nr:TetR family transcriptional regulator [Pseudoxanthomonas sp.]
MTQQKLLEAAMEEFARNGLAGARIDRIAAAAGISKPMLYVYFGVKEALFDAVLAQEIVGAAQDDRFEADDLPGYAGRTYDLLAQRPHLWRLMAWFHLERGQDVLLLPAGHGVLESKLAAIATAQAQGRITMHFTPVEIVRLVTTLVQSWCMAPSAADPHEHNVRRKMIQSAVARLLLPDTGRGPMK